VAHTAPGLDHVLADAIGKRSGLLTSSPLSTFLALQYARERYREHRNGNYEAGQSKHDASPVEFNVARV
jgi:hypothetical protein